MGTPEYDLREVGRGEYPYEVGAAPLSLRSARRVRMAICWPRVPRRRRYLYEYPWTRHRPPLTPSHEREITL